MPHYYSSLGVSTSALENVLSRKVRLSWYLHCRGTFGSRLHLVLEFDLVPERHTLSHGPVIQTTVSESIGQFP
jgi:hypothetical protein